MSIEEMRERLREYCIGKHCQTDNCPLYKKSESCYEDVCDEEVIRNYELVFGEIPKEHADIPDNVNHPKHYQGKH